MAAGKEIKRLRESGIKKILAETLAGYMNVDAAKLRKWEQRNADPKVSRNGYHPFTSTIFS